MVNQVESLVNWLNWLTVPLLCAGLWSWGTYQLAQKEFTGPVQSPSEWDHQDVLCKACIPVAFMWIIQLCLSHIQPRAQCDFYHPYDFLPVRPSEAPVGILRRCFSHGHIRLWATYGFTRLHTYGLVEQFVGLHGYPVWWPYGHRTGPAW